MARKKKKRKRKKKKQTSWTLGVMGPRYTNEEQLYGHVSKLIAALMERLERVPAAAGYRGLENESIAYEERPFEGHTLYLIGEAHFSRTPIDYIHDFVVPVMRQDPRSWLILLEGASRGRLDDLKLDPFGAYFKGLSNVFGVPLDDALADLRARETVERLAGELDASISSVERVVLGGKFERGDPYDSFSPDDIQQAAKLLKKPVDYIHQLLRTPATHLSFDDVCHPWNDICKERFRRIMRDQYSDKRNVLVSVGEKHLPVFC